MQSLLLAAALLAPLHTPSDAPDPEAPAASQVVVIEHAGDNALRDRLVRVMEVWHDAGDFLVGAADVGLIETLGERGIAGKALPAVLDGDELFVVDLRQKEIRDELGETARLVYSHGDQGLVLVPAGTTPRPAGFEPGRVCHGGLVAVSRRPWKPAAPPPAVATRLLGGGGSARLATDARITALVANASTAGPMSDVQMLASNYSRNSAVASYIDTARDQIANRLTSMGYAPQFVTFLSNHGDNIQVEIPGSTTPDEWVVIGAHYDSLNGAGSSAAAPGADDNASGSAAVLEIARVLANASPFERSIRLMWFAGEEYGLYGSSAAASASKSAGETIVGMLNTDMNAYRAPGDTRDVDFATNSTSAWLTSLCISVGAQYVSGWASTQGTLTAGSSDHASYNAEGYPAVFPFEDLSQYSPYIHSSNDTYPQSTPDFDLALMITRDVLATAAVLAEPVDMQITHTPLGDTTNATGPYPVTAQVTSLISAPITAVTLNYSTDGQNYTAVPMTLNGSDWTAAIPSQGSPVTIHYYIFSEDAYAYTEALPDGADLGGQAFTFFVGTKTVIYAQDFEGTSDAGWTHAQVATQDDWQRGVPQGLSGDPATAYSGTKIWGNDLGPSGWNGAYTNNVENWLRAPAVDCSAASNVTLSFRRWLTVENGQYDQAQVRVNNQVVWQNPTGSDLIDSSWVPFSLDISSQAAGDPSVQIEFRLKSDGGVTFGGWNIDDFEVLELGPGSSGCPPPASYCTAKLNSLGCTPSISLTSSPSATAGSGATVTATNLVGGKLGMFLHTTFGADAVPLHNGFLCVAAPFRRHTAQSTGGSAGTCSGVLSEDIDAYIASGADPFLVAGATIWIQAWSRDGGDPFGDSLSNGVSAVICP